MTEKDIHLSLPKEDQISVMKFLNNNNFEKELRYDGELIEILLRIDNKGIKDNTEIAEEITNLIIDVIKDNILKEYIYKQYSEIYTDDKEGIYLKSIELFNQKEMIIKNSINTKVYNYILSNNYINIDGFVKFRMKEFTKYLSAIGDVALEEYLIKKDQDEFINVLKYFIDIQKEKMDLLRVHIMNDNSFILYDKHGNKIDNIGDEEIINMVIKENLNYEDFLISTLLTLCPKKIEILDSLNNNSSKEIISTIISIFDNRVSVIYQS